MEPWQRRVFERIGRKRRRRRWIYAAVLLAIVGVIAALCCLLGWEYKAGSAKRPGFVGKVINECIYKRLPAPVLPKLCEINPVINGHRRRKHHQHLTLTTGIPHLDKQVASETTLMRASRDRRMFEELLVRAFPVPGDQMPLGTATNGE